MAHTPIAQHDSPEIQPASQPDVRVLVVDDAEVFRSTLRELVCATAGFALVGEARSGEDALLAMAEVSPEFVVMDVRMPGMGGIKAARALLERYPDRVVLLISAHNLEEPPPTGPSGQTISFARKADLRCAVLRGVWDGRTGANRPRRTAAVTGCDGPAGSRRWRSG
jgi:CheY-like chemotaxis protein